MAWALVAGSSFADEDIDWKKVRTQQPEALKLKLDLPKKTFYQGETIEGKVAFCNTGTKIYNIWSGDSDFPRAESIAFYATAADGSLVRDPMGWYARSTGYCGSSSLAHENLGSWQTTRLINPWVSFDQPGIYTLFACGTVEEGTYADWLRSLQSRVRVPGKGFAAAEPNWIKVISDPITVTILPLASQEERRLIAEAQRRVALGDTEADKGASALRFLGTPAARMALLPLIGTPQNTIATLGICAAPDPEAEAALVREEVRSGRLKLNRSVISLYRSLKTAFFGQPYTRAEEKSVFDRYRQVLDSSVDEITTAALAATDGKRAEYHQVLIDSFLTNPRPGFRAELVRDQLALEPPQVAALFDSWYAFKGADLQPLVRKATGAPFYNATALRILAETEPAAARPLIIEDLQRDVPRRYSPKGLREGSALFSLPAEPIPELETYFRRQLTTLSPDAEEAPEFLVMAINRYGTPALLPDLVAFHGKEREVRDCEAETSVLKFWVRNDPAGGLEAVRQALQVRAGPNCHGCVLEFVLLNQWTDLALPLLMKALSDPDPQVVSSAIKVLEHNADAKWLDVSFSAIQRALADTQKSSLDASNSLCIGVNCLLNSKRWKLSDLQRRKLEEIEAREREKGLQEITR